MKKPGRWRVLFSLVLLAVVAFAVTWRMVPRNGLLDRAVPLVTRDRWMGPERRNGDVGNYFWLRNDEILLFRRNPDSTITLLRQKVLPPGQVGAATPLPVGLSAQAKMVMISPDRTTIHVLSSQGNAPQKAPTSLKGARRRISMTSEFVSLRDGRTDGILSDWALGEWYEGARCVCQCEYDKKLIATLHYFDGRKDTEIVVNGATGVPLKRGNVWPLFIEASGRVVAIVDSYYDGIITPTQKTTLGGGLLPVRTFVEFNLKDPNRKCKVWTVPVPADAASFYCQVSPGHDRLLWTVQSNRMPIGAAITQKLPKPFRQPTRYLSRWMVSDLDGRNMHTITEFEISDLYFNRPDLIAPQWTPDGMHVSFEYQSALYMMPAD